MKEIEKDFRHSNKIEEMVKEKFMDAVNAYDKASSGGLVFPGKIKSQINEEYRNFENEISKIRRKFNTTYLSYKPILKSLDPKEDAFRAQTQKNFEAETLSLEKELNVLYEKYAHKFEKIIQEIQKSLKKFAQLKESLN